MLKDKSDGDFLEIRQFGPQIVDDLFEMQASTINTANDPEAECTTHCRTKTRTKHTTCSCIQKNPQKKTFQKELQDISHRPAQLARLYVHY